MRSRQAQSAKPTANRANHHQGWILRGILIAIILGVIIGGFFPRLASRFAILGDVFLNALMMIVVPLVIFSMIVGITGLGDIRKLGSIGKRTILYYLITTGISVLIGIILVNIIQPGRHISPGEKHENAAYYLSGPNQRIINLAVGSWEKMKYNDKYVLVLLDQGVQGQIASINTEQATVKYWEPKSTQNIYFLRSAKGIDIPFRHENERLTIAEPVPVTEGQGVEIRLPENIQISQSDNGSVMTTLKEVLVGNRQQEKEGLVPRNIFNAMVKMDILPLIFFSLLLGAAITVLGQKGKLLIEVANVLNDAIMQIVQWIMYFAPFGIFGLIGARIGQEGGFSGFIPELVALGKYSFTILFGLTLHGVIVLPLILYLFARRSPLSYAKGMAPALLNAFSTASSSATLPLTMEGVEKENGISNRTASFVLPLGATVNMDGTALYEAVAAMFIAQIYGITMSPVHQLLIFLTATLAAIGAAGIPQAGLVTMIIVLKAVNLPIEGIGIILTIDWLLDRFRTTVNVWGDSIGAGVVEALELRHQ